MSNANFTHQQSDDEMAQVCRHCLGTQQHEPWCVMRDPKVHYAYEIIDEPRKLTLGMR